MDKTIEVLLVHLATNMHQYLMLHGKVLIPTNISIQVPSSKGAGSGHAAVLYIKKAKDNTNSKLNFFETSGESGGGYAYSAVSEYCRSRGKRAFFDTFIQEELRPVNRSFSAREGDFELRFSRWEVEGKSKRPVTPEDIQKILLQMSVIEEPPTHFSQLNEEIAKLQNIQMDNIFKCLGNFGEVRVPSQCLSFAQVGGECEHESLMAFCDHYLGIVDKDMAIDATSDTDLVNYGVIWESEAIQARLDSDGLIFERLPRPTCGHQGNCGVLIHVGNRIVCILVNGHKKRSLQGWPLESSHRIAISDLVSTLGSESNERATKEAFFPIELTFDVTDCLLI